MNDTGGRNPTASSVLSTLIYTPGSILYFVKVAHFAFLFLCLFWAFSISHFLLPFLAAGLLRGTHSAHSAPLRGLGFSFGFFFLSVEDKKPALPSILFPYHSRAYKLLLELIICNIFLHNGCQVSN